MPAADLLPRGADLGEPIRVIEIQPPFAPVPDYAPAEAPELEPLEPAEPVEVPS